MAKLRRYDARSEEALVWRKWYNTTRWRKVRALQLKKEPLCRMCLAVGVLNNGTLRPDGGEQTKKHRRFLVCDHITPHKGDQDAFWSGPFQTLCPDHHDKQKQIEENRGYSTSVGVDGWPIDPNHPGNRGR